MSRFQYFDIQSSSKDLVIRNFWLIFFKVDSKFSFRNLKVQFVIQKSIRKYFGGGGGGDFTFKGKVKFELL